MSFRALLKNNPLCEHSITSFNLNIKLSINGLQWPRASYPTIGKIKSKVY